MNHTEATEKLGSLLDGELAPDEEAALRAHLAMCDQCRTELADYAALRGAARDLPSNISPTRDLWPSIAARIDDRKIVRLDDRRPASQPTSRSVLAAAAILLVIASSGITAWLVGGGDETTVSPVSETAAVEDAGAITALAAFRPSEVDYLNTVEALTAELDARRHLLDPQTVAVVDRNLRIIDAAIRDSRAALEADPANRDLPLTLSEMYRTKVELLSTAIELPAQT
ncbi:MAG TPA: zf-HC2 domain-containing protein [Longimicrobiaceae bacterium]|nr:zf-HC2 domain-containing protein [Longimicrobiaceae bacterium]